MKKNVQNIVKDESPKALSTLDIAKYIISHSCMYFTAVAIVILIAQMISAGDSEKTIEPLRFILIYPFTFALACADCIFKARSMGLGAKVAIHYAITVIAFYIFVCSPAKSEANPIVILLLLSVIYFIIAAPILIVRAIIKKKNTPVEAYKPVYGKITRK